MEDRSLDEFLDDGDDSEPDESAEPSAPDEPEPPTAHCTPDGEACAACGDTVTRLWIDEGQRVCRDCKHW